MTTISQEQITADFRHDHLDMVKWLLENGMDDINVLNFNDQMPLQAAIENGNEGYGEDVKSIWRIGLKAGRSPLLRPLSAGPKAKPSGSL